MKVVVTIPAYNEAKTIESVLQEIKTVMELNKYNYHLLVVDDGSRDATAEIAKNCKAMVVKHPKNYGLAETFRTEMQKCLELKADVIVHTDADGQYRAEEIPGLIEEVKKGNDLVLASRFMGTIEDMPFLKRLGNKAFSRVLSNITGRRITDGQTGFRAFTKEVAKLPITSTYTYTQEQIIRAARNKFKIKEVPAYFAKRGGKTRSRLMKGPLHYALKAGINLLRVYRDYEPLKFFGAIGALFFGMGMSLGIYLIVRIFLTGDAGGIPRVVLSALLILTAIQIWVFGFLADIFRK